MKNCDGQCFGRPRWRIASQAATGFILAFAMVACGGGSDSTAEDSTQGGGEYGQVILLESNSTAKNFIPCSVTVSDGDIFDASYRCGEEGGANILLRVMEWPDKSSAVDYVNVIRPNYSTEPDPKYKIYGVNTHGSPDDKVVVDREKRTVKLTGVIVSLGVLFDGYGKLTMEQIMADKVKIDGTLNY